jgi:hypothetical protein
MIIVKFRAWIEYHCRPRHIGGVKVRLDYECLQSERRQIFQHRKWVTQVIEHACEKHDVEAADHTLSHVW